MTLVSEISEFELIARLENILKLSSNIPDAQIKFAIGDDAAVITPNSKNQVITSDALVENVHFIYNQISMYNLGWKSLASNYSDVASMGCDPLAVSITLGIKKNQQVEDLEKIYEGFAGITNKFGGTIIGGDIVKSNDFFISISVIGQNNHTSTLMRNDAKPGDLVVVSGELGSSAAGLKLISDFDRSLYENEADKSSKFIPFLTSHFKPEPQIALGRAILDFNITTCTDISDGLIRDLSNICDSSNVSSIVNIDKIPTDVNLKSIFPNDWIELCLSGGEDYQLLFTGTKNKISKIQKHTSSKLTIIGQITKRSDPKISLIDNENNTIKFSQKGWDHFKES